MPQKFDTFKDRAETLLERWQKIANGLGVKNADVVAIKGFLLEINDDYTKYLVEDVLDLRD
jgi:hypothetical protein